MRNVPPKYEPIQYSKLRHPTNLVEFQRESNMIEGILRLPTAEEVAALSRFISLSRITITDLQAYVAVCQPDAVLRSEGQQCWVGKHKAPESMVAMYALKALLDSEMKLDPWATLSRYLWIHPFTDGNGRSSRALWLWAMDCCAPRGFLHEYFYQTLRHLDDHQDIVLRYIHTTRKKGALCT